MSPLSFIYNLPKLIPALPTHPSTPNMPCVPTQTRPAFMRAFTINYKMRLASLTASHLLLDLFSSGKLCGFALRVNHLTRPTSRRTYVIIYEYILQILFKEICFENRRVSNNRQST